MDQPAVGLTGLTGNLDYMVNLSGLGYKNASAAMSGSSSALRAGAQRIES
jgi:hypothetical protein